MSSTEYAWRPVEAMTFDELEQEYLELEMRLSHVRSVLRPLHEARANAEILNILEVENRERQSIYTNEQK